MSKTIFFLLITTILSITQADDTLPKIEVQPKIHYKSPGLSMLFSTVFPGGGQFYCKSYVKGIVFLGAEGALAYYAYQNHRDYLRNNKQKHLDSRNNLLWWLASVKVLSIADAYVTANMYKFNEQMRLSLEWEGDAARIGLASNINILDR
ncbi:MAG: hypothetical protein KGZ86_00885 [Candidatus Latescibacteria bacterium]|nr:hypothetical protein [Candidatus Latescibacterota bacterium]